MQSISFSFLWYVDLSLLQWWKSNFKAVIRIRLEKIKGALIGKEEIKWSLFSDVCRGA